MQGVSKGNVILNNTFLLLGNTLFVILPKSSKEKYTAFLYILLKNCLVYNSHIRHERDMHRCRHLHCICSPGGPINGSQQLRNISKTVYYCINKMMVHMALEGLTTIVTDLTSYTMWKFILGLDSRVDESSISASGVGS